MTLKKFYLTETMIVESLCNGVNPITGEPLNTPRSPEIDALRLKFFTALQKLDKKSKPERESRRNPNARRYQNSGLPWNPELDAALIKRWNSDDRPTLQIIAEEVQRSPLSLSFRLVHLGIATDRDGIAGLDAQRVPDARDNLYQ